MGAGGSRAAGGGQRRPRPAAEEPWREKPRRQVEVEPDDYRPRRRRRLSKQSVLLIFLVLILVAGVVFAGGKLMSIMLNYRRDRSAYNDLADQAISGLAEPNVTPDPNAEPEVVSEVPFELDWSYLQGQNSEVVGWIYCEGTAINYPVVQTVDNDFYLHRGFDRQPNTSGTLFVDPKSGLGITYSNYIIYGHNMKDGSMFAAVESYLDPNFYTQHPVMYYMTPGQNYRIDLISAHIVESTLNNYPAYFDSDGKYADYLNTITSRSSFYTNATVSTQYQLITLSTCDYSSNYNDPRCLLQGLLIPIE